MKSLIHHRIIHTGMKINSVHHRWAFAASQRLVKGRVTTFEDRQRVKYRPIFHRKTCAFI